ncbi:AI-2E family transporter [Rubritalea spongiae]|uniref:AI-2E family transporter n=1 Tax=Rubritalea spongiae TaxID=430797 RepID=A0ABW5E463_9BACT
MKPTESDKAFVRNAIDAAVKIFLISLLVVMSYKIIQPFVMLVLWAIIIAVAFSPLIDKITKMCGGKRKLVCIGFGVAAVAVLILPVFTLAESSVQVVQNVAGDLKQNEAHFLKEAPSRVEEIPVVGKKVSEIWNLAATDFKAALKATAPLAQDAATKLVATIGSGLSGVLHFAISFIIAAVLLISPEKGFSVTRKIARSFAGERGEEFTKLTIATIRGVMTGVIGVAVIQAVLATIGLLVMGIPAAGVWGVLVLICAIVQLPPILVLGPIAGYAFTQYDTVPAVIFLVYSFIVSASDGVLKPILMARGVDTPMLVILLGAIGGMIMSGIVGLFVGAVVLSITYAIFMAWVNEKELHLSGTTEFDEGVAE